ncbi:MAG: DUF4105 domain-containing protein [Planctomycetota bacterium]
MENKTTGTTGSCDGLGHDLERVAVRTSRSEFQAVGLSSRCRGTGPRWTARLCAVLVLWGGVTPLAAQSSPPDPSGSVSSLRQRAQSTEFVLLTASPGAQIWEHYGHNEIVAFDVGSGKALSYNYGVFDMERPGFYRDFFFGDWQYRVGVFSVEYHLEEYRRAGRTVWLQHLELNVEQRAQLLHFLEENAKEENAWYRYHYYLDNCSTRVRDALDQVLGGRIRAATVGLPGSPPIGGDPADTVSFRYHTLRLSGHLTASGLLAYFGTMLVFGTPIERPISVWEEMFIPMVVRDAVRRVTVVNEWGAEVPLVDREETIPPGARPRDPPAPPSWILPCAAVGIFAALLLVLLARAAPRRRVAWGAFVLGATFVSFTIGVCGVFIDAVWALTRHESAHANVNVLYFTPLALLLALVTPFAASGRPGALRWARGLALITLGLTFLGLLLEWIPAFAQTNGPLLALVLPLHAALAFVWLRWPRATITGR